MLEKYCLLEEEISLRSEVDRWTRNALLTF